MEMKNVKMYYNEEAKEMTILIKGVESKGNPLYDLLVNLVGQATKLSLANTAEQESEDAPKIDESTAILPAASNNNAETKEISASIPTDTKNTAEENKIPAASTKNSGQTSDSGANESLNANKESAASEETLANSNSAASTKNDASKESAASSNEDAGEVVYYKWPKQFSSFKRIKEWLDTNMPNVKASYDADKKAIKVLAGADEMDKKFQRL